MCSCAIRKSIIENAHTPNSRHDPFVLQQTLAYIDSKFANTTVHDWKQHSVINSTVLRYLHLTGDYLADQPLRIPSLFVLELSGTVTPAHNLSITNVSRFTGLIEMRDVYFSAVIGGTFDASSLPAVENSRGYECIIIVGGSHNAIRGVRAIANNSDSAIGVNMSPHAEVSNCDVGGRSEKWSCLFVVAVLPEQPICQLGLGTS